MPIVFKELSAARRFSRPRAVVCGHYYCIGPKVGSLFYFGTQLPFKRFPSHPNWISNCGRSEKFSIASARIERMECAKNIGAFQHFRSFGTVTQETCYGCKKWNYQKLHYVVVFSAAVLYNP